MNDKEFEKISQDFLVEAGNRLVTKGHEYSTDIFGSHDRYSQLTKQAELNGLTIESEIIVMMSKHIVMLCDLNHEMKYAEFKERALDVIAYLCLMNGCYKEAENL